MSLVLGIDPSLTSTGLAVVDTAERAWLTERVRTKPVESLAAMAERMRTIANEVGRAAHGLDWGDRVDLVVIEGLSFGSQGSATRNLAGLWWLIVDGLVESGFRVEEVAPATRAKYATGNGRASKSDVLASVRDLHPTADVPGHDVADAVAMAALGARRLGFPVEARERPWLGEVAAGLRW